MRKNISAIIEAFQAGRAKSDKSCSTDGNTIFSYAMPIARRMPDGTIWAAGYKDGPSATTRGQIHAVRCALGLGR